MVRRMDTDATNPITTRPDGFLAVGTHRFLEDALSMNTLRVVQFATGNVGSEMVKRIVEHPDLELVGLYCYSPDKVGRDAGEIVGIAPLGVSATNDIADVLRDETRRRELQRRLAGRRHVLHAARERHQRRHHLRLDHRLPPRSEPSPPVREKAHRTHRSCVPARRTTFYGTGMNPGLAQILSVVATAGMGRVDHITVLETVDVSCHHSVDTWKNVGYGRPVDDPEVPGLLETGCTVFADSIYLMADCLDLEIDDIVFECELGACTEDVDLGWWTLAKGVGGRQPGQVQGDLAGGEPKIEVHLEWQMTPKTEPAMESPGVLHHHHRG